MAEVIDRRRLLDVIEETVFTELRIQDRVRGLGFDDSLVLQLTSDIVAAIDERIWREDHAEERE